MSIEPQPAKEPSAPPDVVGEVVDSAGSPIESADVSLFDPAGRLVSGGSTGRSGAFRLPRVGADVIVVRHVSFTTASHSLPLLDQSGGDPIRMILQVGSVIEGDVRLPWGSAPATPIRVLATPLGTGELSRVRLGELELDDPRRQSALCDASGRFRITGLAPGSRCVIRAAGPGLALVTQGGPPTLEAVAGGAPVHLVVAPLYVLDVRLRGPTGEPIETSPSLGMWCSWEQPHDCLGEYVRDDSLLDWAGASALGRADCQDPFRLFVLLAGTLDQDTLGPLEFSAFPPGYGKVTASLSLPRLSTRMPSPQEIRLERTTEGFGRLRVRFADSGSLLRDTLHRVASSSRSGLLALRLYPEDRRALGRPYLSIPLAGCLVDPLEVAGVPFGKYRAVLRIPFASVGASCVPNEISVDGRAEGELLVEVPEWTALEVDPKLDGGPGQSSYEGPLSVTLRQRGTDIVAVWSFSRRPYVMAGFEPRSYDVAVRYASLESAWVPIDPPAGKVMSIELLVRPSGDGR